jgi:hypothetical protein
VPESWFALSREDQAEALEVASGRGGRPAHLLEKDLWVVWILSVIYESPHATKLTFKGGTSLSKVYKIIDRFSEDIDLTYDIRELVPDLLSDGDPIPATPSQEKKITSAVRARLSRWIKEVIKPLIEAALSAANLQAELTIIGKDQDKLVISYPAVKAGTGYAAPTVLLEFGARSTGEPNARHEVNCDIASYVRDIAFPSAQPLVMFVERTFWEKATAVHVYCHQQRPTRARYSRHWYDLAAIAKTAYFGSAVRDRHLAKSVAEHKSLFFSEKDEIGSRIDYFRAVNGSLKLIPEGASLTALAEDYAAMLEDGLLPVGQPQFSELLDQCRSIEEIVNRATDYPTN